MWLFPDGTRNLEISTKCEPREAFQVSTELKAYLKSVGIDLTGNQQTKTRAAMEFYKPEVQQKARTRKARLQA